MFFVTLLLNAYITWMRSQSGSSVLKSILYMDEIFGFFPPSKNPPSKEPMLLLLKQARAFGCGIILSTQNPVDIDYKGLANIGTWFIGKLQTKQDIAKVIDGIAANSTLSKEELATKIATLKGRHFFIKNIHEEQTQEFSTRWVLSYLKGPMNKDEIKKLMSEQKELTKRKDAQTQKDEAEVVTSKPILHKNIKEYFSSKNAASALYPYLYAELRLTFFNQKKGINTTEELAYKLPLDAKTFTLEWADAYEERLEEKSDIAVTNASYAELPQIISQANTLKSFEKNLNDFIYETKNLELLTLEDLDLESKLHENKEDFLARAQERLHELQEQKSAKAEEKFQSEKEKLQVKLQTLQQRLQKEKSEASAKMTDTLISAGLTLVSAFFGKKAMSATTLSKGASTLTKGKSMLKERSDVTNVEQLISDVTSNIEILEADFQDELEKITKEMRLENYAIESLIIKPKRSDITITDFALLWER
jgi:hypothetical protein